MGSAISGCRRRLAHWEHDGIVDDRKNCSYDSFDSINRDDILLACHNPSIYKHGSVYLMHKDKTNIDVGKKGYLYDTLENPHFVDSEDGWEKYRDKKKFKYIWGINCQLNIPTTFSNIIRNAYNVLVDGGLLIFPIPVGFEVKGESYPTGWNKMFHMEEIKSDKIDLWLESDPEKPHASKFLVFTKLGAGGGRRRKTMRKRGRRRTQKTKR